MAETLDPTRALETILSEHGPLPFDDIEDRLRDAGVIDPDAGLDVTLLETHYPARPLVDDRWVWLPAVLAGRVFTHYLSAAETAHDVLAVSPDLGPITTLCEHAEYQRLADGSTAQIVLVDYDDELLQARGIPDEAVGSAGSLLLEPGTLARLGAADGDLVGLRLTAQGLTLERAAPPGPGAGAGVSAWLAAAVHADDPVDLTTAVWTACVEDPAVFAEAPPPLSEIVAAAGLARQGDLLAADGFDFEAWRSGLWSEILAERHGLDPDDAFVLHTLIQLHERITLLLDGVDEESVRRAAANQDATIIETGAALAELCGALTDPVLAELLAEETDDTGLVGAAALGVLAETLESKVPRAARVAFRWLRAMASERLGDIAGAERELLAAESMDTDWPLPLFDLAHIASDRGDAEGGLALLHRAGADPDHPLVGLLERHRTRPRSDLGRNEPCWCESGRKYKRCHLGREELPLADRADWLYDKAVQHTVAGDWTALLTEAAYERGRCADEDEDEALIDALADPLVMDAVLFEGGAFEEFLAVRGSLLPDDEQALAEQWLRVQRSVFEVVAVQPGRGATVRDVRTGDTHEVHERVAGGRLQPGQLICTRVAPAGDATVFLGGIEPVAPPDRDALIELLDDEPGAVQLVTWLTRAQAGA